ncbi:hypothetical protein [Pendulispora albinea]|uniref:TerB family tellurite resistance protein n=1 Tax=Pendulispora albinea TaxID=2741071 RepID=A0ABZ2LKF9_9BACT
MHEEDLAIIKALVPVAWADDVFAEKEEATLEALLVAFNATDEERKLIREYAKEKKTLDDIELQDLSADDRRILLQHAVLLSFVDGEQGEEERQFLDALVVKLKLPPEEANELMAFAAERAKKQLEQL